MQLFELVIFDLDGTLVDSQYDLSAAVNYTRSLYGLSALKIEEVRGFVGDGVRVLIEKALPGVTGHDIESAVIKFKAYYGEHLLDSTRLYPGVKLTLEETPNIIKAILTNKPEEFSKAIVKGLKIDKFFEVISGGDSGLKRKPDPAPILDIINRLNISSRRTLMVGDGVNDIIASKAAGINCVAVEYGYSKPETLRELKPDYVIKSIDELKTILDGTGG